MKTKVLVAIYEHWHGMDIRVFTRGISRRRGRMKLVRIIGSVPATIRNRKTPVETSISIWSTVSGFTSKNARWSDEHL